MNDRPTAAYPPRLAGAPPAGPDTQAQTLFAQPAASRQAQTLLAPSSQETLDAAATMLGSDGANPPTLAPGSTSGAPGGARVTRGSVTVLPEVRSEGDRIILQPRAELRYRSEKLLGRGGMGEVKLATDHDIGRTVAVKRLLDDGNAHAVARFIDEVRTVGSLEHPNIIPIHDVGVDEDGALFFVMKYVDGETLAEVIAKLAAGDRNYHGEYTFERRLDLFAGLLRALQYAHSQGLVHRDIKPENIMIGRYGEVVVMDWGIAHQMRSETRPSGAGVGAGPGTGILERASNETVDGSVVGTPQYMSPEQAAGEAATLDGRSDLYSAHAVLWELLTLTPYIADALTPMQAVLAVQDKQPPVVTDSAFEHPHQAPVPIELRHFLRRGLQPKREDRPQAVDDVLHDLEMLRSGECMADCPITLMKRMNSRMERFMDRYPGASMSLALMAGLALLSGVVGWGVMLVSALT